MVWGCQTQVCGEAGRELRGLPEGQLAVGKGSLVLLLPESWVVPL